MSFSLRPLLSGVALLLVLAGGCNRAGKEPTAPLSIQVTSSSIPAGVLNKMSTCDGQGVSPQLAWTAPPAATRSLALVVTDRDAPLGYNFVHWVVYNIPPGTSELPEGFSARRSLVDGAVEGPNDSDKPGYFPPCPPAKSSHRYDFILYAVDTTVNLPSASKKQLLDAIGGHVLARGELVARYGR